MAVDGTDDDQLVSISTEDVVRASRLVNNEICVLEASRTLPNLDPLASAEPSRKSHETCSLVLFVVLV